MAKLPAFQFYPGDWMKDPALRACSLAARGLWIDALSLMFESSRRGYLQHATGKPVTTEQLARMVGCSSDEVSRLLQELDDAGVFSRTDSGVVFSRRMVRDERKREKCRRAGKLGGNPTLKGGVKGVSKGGVKGGANRKPTPSSSPSPSGREETPSGVSSPPAAAPGRPRNLLFDAVAEVTGSDARVSGTHVGRVAALLARGEPPYSPDEVRDFGRRFGQLCPWSEGRRPTVGELEKYIGLVRSGQPAAGAKSGGLFDATDRRPRGDVRRPGRAEPEPGEYDAFRADAAGQTPGPPGTAPGGTAGRPA